jgi:hypothetical protein
MNKEGFKESRIQVKKYKICLVVFLFGISYIQALCIMLFVTRTLELLNP